MRRTILSASMINPFTYYNEVIKVDVGIPIRVFLRSDKFTFLFVWADLDSTISGFLDNAATDDGKVLESLSLVMVALVSKLHEHFTANPESFHRLSTD